MEARLNALNPESLNRLESSGGEFLSNAIVDGEYALRGWIFSFPTTEAYRRAGGDWRGVGLMVRQGGSTCLPTAEGADRIDRSSVLRI